MTDQEWREYLATLPPELAAIAYNTAERVNTLLNRERSKAIDERQALERRLDAQGVQINDLRTIVKDLFDRIAELEQSKTKAVNDASNDA